MRLINGIPHVDNDAYETHEAMMPRPVDMTLVRMHEAAVALSAEGRAVEDRGMLYFNGAPVAYLMASAYPQQVEAFLVYLDRDESFIRLRKEDFE